MKFLISSYANFLLAAVCFFLFEDPVFFFTFLIIGNIWMATHMLSGCDTEELTEGE